MGVTSFLSKIDGATKQQSIITTKSFRSVFFSLRHANLDRALRRGSFTIRNFLCNYSDNSTLLLFPFPAARMVSARCEEKDAAEGISAKSCQHPKWHSWGTLRTIIRSEFRL